MSKISLFGFLVASALVSLAFAATAKTEITVDNVQYSVAGGAWNSIKLNEKSTTIPSADQHQVISLKFVVKDKATGEPFPVHQAFVAFVHSETLQEIIFISETDSTGTHVAEIDLKKTSDDFKGLSGVYNVRLIIGDFAVAQGINWNLMDVKLSLPKIAAPVVKKSQKITYEKLPEIHHIFREPEPRPSQFVSSIFTLVCLAPLGLLAILWLAVGINFSNMPITIWTPLFHIGLFSIFFLYYLFWLQLNMFQTLNYLALVGTFTFLSGNRLLRVMSAQRKTKTE